MCRIVLKDIISQGNFPDSGRIFHDMLKSYLDQKRTIVIDMSEVVSLPTLFMNTSFGVIIDECGADILKKNVKFDNIGKSQMFRIQKYFDDYTQVQRDNNQLES